MTSTLPHFWQLASSSRDDRLKSAHGLITTLTAGSAAPQAEAEQDADANGLHLFDDGLSATGKAGINDDFITEQQIREAESALSQAGNNELAYAIKRLIKGLASHRESSRLGFSVALCELLARIDAVDTSHILTLIFAYSQTNGGAGGSGANAAKARGQEERDLLYARLFGIHALVLSGALVRSSKSAKNNAQRAMRMLIGLSQGKPWLRESGTSVLIQLIKVLEQTDNGQDSWQAGCLQWLMDKICKDKNVTADSVAIYITLRQTAAEGTFAKSQRLPHFASQEILTLANLPTLAKLLRDANIKDEGDENPDGSANAAGLASGSRQAHLLWDIILSFYSEEQDATSKRGNAIASFDDVFRILVDENLFNATSSHQKKSWGFQVWQKAAELVRPEFVAQIFTTNLMRTLMNQLSGKDRLLHKSAQKACLGLQDAAKRRPEIASTIVKQLIGANGNLRFDAVTNTKTVESILRYLSKEEVRQYTDDLIRLSCSDVSDGVRKSIFDQLLIVVRSVNIETDDECTENVLTFFVLHGLFDSKKPLKQDAKPISLTITLSSTLSNSARESCRSRFLSCLGDLHDRGSAEWITKGYEIIKRLDRDTKHFERRFKTNIGYDQKTVEQHIGALQKGDVQETAFKSLMIASLIYVQCSDVDEDESKELIEPLVHCHDRLLSGTVKGTQQDEADAMELFVDCLSNALQPASAFLRGVATSAFDAFADRMTRAAMRLLLEQLGFNDSKQEDGEDNVDEDAEDGNDGSDSASATSATSSEPEEEDDEDEMAEDVDEDFAAKVRLALQSGGVADEEEGEDSGDAESQDSDSDPLGSELNDDQMMLIDDKLADIFRQKFSARKQEEEAKREEVAYHVRILDLLEHFARNHSSNALCIEMVLPLFSITMEKAEKGLEPLRQRASNVLQRTLLKGKNGPVGVSAEEVADAMDAIHKLACSNLTNAQLSLASAANVYLTRSCLHDVQGVPQRIIDVYKATLTDFMERKANNLKPSFLVDAFTRFPRLGLALRDELVRHASGDQVSSQHSFRQVQVMEMLRTVLTQMISSASQKQAGDQTRVAKGDEASIDALLTQVARLTLQRVQKDQLRIKDIVKIGLQLVRLTVRWAEQSQKSAASFVESVWPQADIQASLTALETTNVLPNATSVQNLLKQYVALTQRQKQGASDAGATKRKTEAEAGATRPKNKKNRKA